MSGGNTVAKPDSALAQVIERMEPLPHPTRDRPQWGPNPSCVTLATLPRAWVVHSLGLPCSTAPALPGAGLILAAGVAARASALRQHLGASILRSRPDVSPVRRGAKLAAP